MDNLWIDYDTILTGQSSSNASAKVRILKIAEGTKKSPPRFRRSGGELRCLCGYKKQLKCFTNLRYLSSHHSAL